jgi:uncharacterized protein (TIGR03435 family)
MYRFLAFVTAAVALAQSGPDKLPSFEVASIKPSPPGSHGKVPTVDPGLFSARLPLKSLVMWAYDFPLDRDDRVAGGPDWVETVYYDVDARCDSPVSHTEIMLMLRSLLADRFQLKLHRETRPILSNVVTVAKGGPKFGPDFHELKEGDPPPDNSVKSSPTHMVYPGIPLATFLSRLRLMMVRDPEARTFVKVQDVPPLLDETGLAGRYYIVFNGYSDEPWSFTLQRQLGLKLEERKVPTEVIVIDSAVRPSGN